MEIRYVPYFIDLFSGIGGFRVALERKGMTCVFSCEIDADAADTYYQNFSESPDDDITLIDENTIPFHDVICAGFPCQSFSIAGKRKGVEDYRGLLFYEIIRIALTHQPAIMILENVPNLVQIDNCNTYKAICQELFKAGYEIYPDILNASEFGIPQARKRLYIVCIKKDSDIKFERPQPTHEPVYMESCLDQNPDPKLIIDRNDIVIENNNEPPHELQPIRIGHIAGGGQGERIYHPNGHAVTITANGGGVGSSTGLYLINGVVRRLSIQECKRIMGFPEDFYIPESKKGYQQLGNAVIPKMIEKLIEGIS